MSTQPPSTSGLSEKDRLDYYWKHFALIADQRVKTFNFYIIVILATLAGTIQMLRPSTPRLTLFLIGLGHMFAVIVFWLIESRGRAIVDIARQALRSFEESSAFGDGYKPMTEENKKSQGGSRNFVKYGIAFRLVFVAHFLFGAVIALWPSLIIPYPPVH